MKNLEAIITIGPAATGKSTWAYKFVEENKNWRIIERDAIRKTMQPKEYEEENFWKTWNFKRENEVTDRVNEMIERFHGQGMNLIFSDTNLNPKFREELKKKLENLGYNVTYKLFNLEYKKLLENDNKRADSVGQQVITKMYFQFMEQFGSEFGFVKHYKSHNALKAVIFDIDGTLAHMDRSKRSPYDWNKVHLDIVDEEMRELTQFYYDAGYEVIIMSGRDGVCIDLTFEWLVNSGVNFSRLLMRPEGDQRPDFIIKNELFQKYIQGNYNVKAWYDDRPVVVRLGHILGVKMFAVGNQHLEF